MEYSLNYKAGPCWRDLKPGSILRTKTNNIEFRLTKEKYSESAIEWVSVNNNFVFTFIGEESYYYYGVMFYSFLVNEKVVYLAIRSETFVEDLFKIIK